MARHINRLLTDEDAYNTARIEGMAHAAQYTIERMAEETEKIYKKVLS